MKQMSLGESGFERKTKRTRKREFLDEMNLVVPWAELVSLIAPHAPAPGSKGGRPPFAVETMLRIHFIHVWTRRLLQALFADDQRSAHMYTAC
jgi:IS5 family transposase